MKRCPQCEFIYEDDQSLCDMDGVLLVFDSRNLPNHHALATVPVKPQPRRNRAVPAFATLILALVLGMVYYVSTQRQATPPVIETPASAVSTSDPVLEVNPTPEAQPSSEASDVPPPAEEPQPSPTKQTAAAPVKKASVKTASTTTSDEPKKNEPKKDDSKVGSILKKTGRILKKPFKL